MELSAYLESCLYVVVVEIVARAFFFVIVCTAVDQLD